MRNAADKKTDHIGVETGRRRADFQNADMSRCGFFFLMKSEKLVKTLICCWRQSAGMMRSSATSLVALVCKVCCHLVEETVQR